MLKTPMLITLVILTVSNLNNVEAPLIVTGGGPAEATNILPLYLYMTAFFEVRLQYGDCARYRHVRRQHRAGAGLCEAGETQWLAAAISLSAF